VLPTSAIRSTLVLLAATLGPAAAQRPIEPAKPLNFVFFLVDDLGWRDLGCYGSTFYETPNIDALAHSAMRFTNAYAACPVCSPTRASILAGKYPARMHTTDYFGGRRKGKLLPADYIHQLPREEVTIAEALKEAGYRTGFFGKWHLGHEPFTPESQGFDVNKGGYWAGMPRGGYFSPYKNPKLPDGPKGEPFLLYFAFYAVHTPLQTTQKLRKKYEAKAAKLPEPDGPRWKPEGRRKTRQVQDHPVYAGMVESVDTSVGRVLDELERLGLSDRTAIILMSDNGGLSTSEGHPTSNLPLRAGKGWLYEGGIREPMIVRWPGHTKPGSACDSPVISTDFYPTMLEMAGLGLRPKQHVDGRSFAPLLRGEHGADRGPLFWHYPHYGNQGGSPSGAIRDGSFKLIEFFEDDRIELFDLARDIGEEHDLASEMPEKAAEMRKELHAWRVSVDARMPRPNPDWKGRR